MTDLADLYPVLGLRITAGPLELRGARDEDLAALVDVALRGVHEPERMPFAFPWTDAPAEELPRRFAQYHWGGRVSFTPVEWTLDLVASWDGVIVGTQGVMTRDYLVTRQAETGSWLGREFQGRGIGTAMRRAICAFLFDSLDAQLLNSGAFTDNPASMAVSRKVGYQPNGTRRIARRPGEYGTLRQLILTPETFVRGEPITVEGLAPVRRLVGLDAE